MSEESHTLCGYLHSMGTESLTVREGCSINSFPMCRHINPGSLIVISLRITILEKKVVVLLVME